MAENEGQPAPSGAPKWMPTIILHVLYPDSRKVGFGWWLFILASTGAFFLHKSNGDPKLTASDWLICSAFASALIGGGSVADAKHDLEMAKLAAATPPTKEPDGPQTTA